MCFNVMQYIVNNVMVAVVIDAIMFGVVVQWWCG